jgi:predicted SnoaL-like aldol condensation-catalyzing enzyme
MSAADNKAIFRRFVAEVMNQGNISAIDELFAPDFVGHIHLPPAPPMNREDVKLLFSTYHSAFSGFQATIEDLIAEGDKVVGRLTARGTHTGTFAGIRPTGKQVTFQTIDIFRTIGDTIVEHWAMPDQFGLRQQLGVIPPLG